MVEELNGVGQSLALLLFVIKVYPESGTGSGIVTINIDTNKMIPGRYQGTIIVASNGGVKTGSI